MSYRLELQCPPTFEKLIENGIKIEDAFERSHQDIQEKTHQTPPTITIVATNPSFGNETRTLETMMVQLKVKMQNLYST